MYLTEDFVVSQTDHGEDLLSTFLSVDMKGQQGFLV